MSFFDCPECWETPCRCGYMYRNWTKEQRRDLAIAAMKSVPSEQEFSSLESQLSEASEALGADGEMTLDLVKAWRNAYWDGPFQDAKNRLCDFVIAAMTENAKNAPQDGLAEECRTYGGVVRYIHAGEVTKAQREQAQNSELHKQGDMILIWVNEGDLYRMKFKKLKS